MLLKTLNSILNLDNYNTVPWYNDYVVYNSNIVCNMKFNVNLVMTSWNLDELVVITHSADTGDWGTLCQIQT